MFDPPATWLVALGILLLNVPFGYWRAWLRRLSLPWFVAIHAPIPLAIGLRFAFGVPFTFTTLPVFVLAFLGGQLLGSVLRRTTGS